MQNENMAFLSFAHITLLEHNVLKIALISSLGLQIAMSIIFNYLV